MPTIASDPHQHKGQVVANGHCARHVQAVTGIGHSSTWRRGEQVRTAGELEPGTVIATFADNGRYASATDGSSHIAILLERRPEGLLVVDQWVGRPVGERVIQFRNGDGSPVNDGDQYHVVELA